MNKLFIIGNGFDLAHGLKTSYKDFLVWYFRKVFTESINDFNYSDELVSLSRNQAIYPPYEINSFEDFGILMYKFNITFKFKFDFFAEIALYSDENWYDIEQLYYNNLIRLIKSLIEVPVNAQSIKSKIEDLNQCFQIIKLRLIEYLNTININYNKNISNISKNLHNIINLSHKHNMYEKENRKKRALLLKEIKPFENILFASFNYTDTIEKLYIQRENREGITDIDIIYIHGNLNNSKKIIFGYGDEIDEFYSVIENQNKNEYLQNIKSFGYYKDNQYKKLLTFIESGNFEVHLLGHSCGLSDRVLLNTVFEHNNCKHIKIYYHDKGNNNNNFTELTMNISRHFRDKAKMRARIRPFDECQPLVTGD